MKVFIVAASLLIVLSSFHVFAADTGSYLYAQMRVKSAANDCANAAALYSDPAAYALGHKVYDKDSGNAAALHVLKSALSLTDDMHFSAMAGMLSSPCSWAVYYFDGDGGMEAWRDGVLQSSGSVAFPYHFTEPETLYEAEIREAAVIVTIDAGIFDYSSAFIEDPRLIRTSSYEQTGR
jgi:hypothetical protein